MVSAGIMTITRNAVPAPSSKRYSTLPAQGSVTYAPIIMMDETTERDYVSNLWAEDWDSPEDSANDR